MHYLHPFTTPSCTPPPFLHHPLTVRAFASMADPSFHSSQCENCPDVYTFFEKRTSTWQYVVVDPATKNAALIDTVLDYDAPSGRISTTTADGILAFIEKQGLKIEYILETHAHADHLTASQYYKKKFNVPIGIGKRISLVQETFAPVYGFEPSALEGSFDLLFDDDEEFKLGALICRVMHLPGHTPDHVSYVIGECVFTGDSIFQPDVGSARCDFPGGDAKALYSSMQRLMALPEHFRLFVGHDYPDGRSHFSVSTVGEQRMLNKHSKVGVTEAEFVEFRRTRDSVLGAPQLLHPSLQTNIRGGRLPPRDGSGRLWFRIPLTPPVGLAA
ncbi:Metallo-hydrolase/oxidoreductase [Mycena sanguinolenta]|uniref:Metallo-hydrolase/oxidoreductase n=1 Tax=Mycena sanguinolenta TaxID=230812 RepID=A0A8H6XAA6_9AGAR|nr:Metallo-hydrolase/oxidoreductase [Mycena sanguinolenta]